MKKKIKMKKNEREEEEEEEEEEDRNNDKSVWIYWSKHLILILFISEIFLRFLITFIIER